MNQEFLEKYPLYRKLATEIPLYLSMLNMPPIHMECGVCGSAQTFNMREKYHTVEAAGAVVRAIYVCASCEEFRRYFFLKFDPAGKYVMKIGQEPPWEIAPDRTLATALGSRERYYKKGLICESQSYGIGAFACYRRIVEEIIDELLNDIADLISGEDHTRYMEALEKVKKTTVAQDKIELVKNLLPPILRPDGMNPLGELHRALSEGLHGRSDEECIALAMEIREVLVFLINQVAVTKTAGASFTDSMRKLLDRRKI